MPGPRGWYRCSINVWSALRHVMGGGEAESSPMCRCGHSAMCHWYDAYGCRLIDYVTDDLCGCPRFLHSTPGN